MGRARAGRAAAGHDVLEPGLGRRRAGQWHQPHLRARCGLQCIHAREGWVSAPEIARGRMCAKHWRVFVDSWCSRILWPLCLWAGRGWVRGARASGRSWAWCHHSTRPVAHVAASTAIAVTSSRAAANTSATQLCRATPTSSATGDAALQRPAAEASRCDAAARPALHLQGVQGARLLSRLAYQSAGPGAP